VGRSGDEVASLILFQKLAETKERVARWIKEVKEADERGKVAFAARSLDAVCHDGEIRCIISSRQAAWLSKMIARDRHERGSVSSSIQGRFFGSPA
jgi:hypothetical protein